MKAEPCSARSPSGYAAEGERHLNEIARILDNVDCEVYFFDSEMFHILYANRVARENLGFSIDELSRMTPLDLKRDFTPGYFVTQLQKLRTGDNDLITYSTFHYRKDGTCYPLELRIRECTFRGSKAFIASASNATDLTRTEEHLKRTLEDLAKLNRYETVINTVTQAVHKTMDLNMVMENAVEAISRNMDDVNNICIYLREGWEAVMQAHRGYPEWFVQRVSRIPFPKGFTWRTIIDGRMIYVPDSEKDTVIGPAGRELGTKSYISIPIKSHGQTVGAIVINSDNKYSFGPDELRVLEIVSQQIETAINNARYAESLLLSEKALEEKLRQLSKKEKYETIINTVSQSVHSSIDLDVVMENAVTALAKNIDYVEMVSIFMIEENELVLKAESGFPEWFKEKVRRVRRPTGLMWKTVMEGKTLYVPDTEIEKALGPAGKEAGVMSYAGLPVRLGDETIGCIAVSSRKKRVFSEDELNLLEIIKEQIETAILNAKHAEALAVSEERYQTLADLAPIGIFRSDTQGRGVYVNSKLCEITGITREEAHSGRWIDRLHPEDREYVVGKWTEALRTHQKFREEYRFIHRDGSVVWVIAQGREELSPQGEFKGLVGTLTDITERKLSEEKILFQASLLDQVRNSVIATDLEDKIIYWNKYAEELYQWKAEEVRGMHIIDAIAPEDQVEEFEEIVRAAANTGHSERDLVGRRKDGSTFPVYLALSVIKDERGKTVGHVGVGTDITEKKMLEGRLLRAQRLESIGTLAGGIAHDLNNILQPIMMSIQLLKPAATGKKYESIVNVMESSAERGADLIRQVLSFARGMDSNKQTINLRYLITDTLKIIKETFPKSIEIKTHTEGDIRNISGDFTQLNQVLLNICVNARDAMPDGGELSISTRNTRVDPGGAVIYRDIEPGEYVEIAIADTGCGIESEFIDKIFDPFFSTKDVDKGTGLGLSTAYGIIKEHGGYIHVQSEPGKGSKFIIYLPAAPLIGLHEPGAEDIDLAKGGGETILIVDDEAAVLDITKAILEAFGYKVLAADNGHEALDIMSDPNNKIDAAVVDMMMPVIGGKVVIRSLKKKHPALKIISVSGYQRENELIEVDEKLLDAFLSKPFKAETLLETLHKVLHESDNSTDTKPSPA